MKPLLIPLIITLHLVTITKSDEKWKHFGKEFSIEEYTSIVELNEHPEKYFNKDIKIKGIIASACNEEGCFIEVVPEDGKGEGIVVNFSDLTTKFPTDCAGRDVIVEGMFYQKIYPETRVKHWQGHSFRKGKNVPEYSLIKRIHARAVKIGTTKRAIPQPIEIIQASIDKIDLNLMEFEAEGFGTGKKILKPGEITGEHTTGKSREIVICLEGTITVLKENAQPITLSMNEMTFIPPGIKHEIKNLSDKTASYIFVYARKIEQEKKEHKH